MRVVDVLIEKGDLREIGLLLREVCRDARQVEAVWRRVLGVVRLAGAEAREEHVGVEKPILSYDKYSGPWPSLVPIFGNPRGTIRAGHLSRHTGGAHARFYRGGRGWRRRSGKILISGTFFWGHPETYTGLAS